MLKVPNHRTKELRDHAQENRWSDSSTTQQTSSMTAENRHDKMTVEEDVELPKSPLPVRPFRIRYIAQDRGPELENAPGFMLRSWLWKQQQLRPMSNTQQEERKGVSRKAIEMSKGLRGRKLKDKY